MKVTKFEDLKVWQKSIDIAVILCKHFEKHTDFEYSNQIRRAAFSISNNIAEGFERSTNKDFNRFLNIAKGSCSEVKSMLYLGFKLGYFTDFDMKKYFSQIDEIGKMIYSLSKTLTTKN